jgi:uncharacterized protein YcfJ
MKNFILSSVLVLVATPVWAEYPVNAKITDHFKIATRDVPVTEHVCETVNIPIYGGSNTGDTIAGAIIGGAMGNQFGGGSGKDAMTVLGAIVGADVANRNSQNVTGYRQKRQCQDVTTYITKQEEIYSHSTISWRENNRTMTLEFQR